MSEQTKHPGHDILAFPESYIGGDAPHEGVGGGMSLRQYAAIHLRVPDSGLDWLDAMIDKARRDEFAGKAMAQMLSHPDNLAAITRMALAQVRQEKEIVASVARELADALLAELDKGVGQ